MAERTLTGVGVSPGRGAARVVVAPPRVAADGAEEARGLVRARLPVLTELGL